MRWLTQLRMRLAMLFQRSTATAYLDSELRFHLDQQIGEYIAAGMNPQEARQAAMRSFGNPTLLRDQTRATWSWHWLESLLRDIRYGARTLWRTPGFSLVAIAVMALCIGAATSLFTVVRSVLLKPLPFRDPDRLVMVYERHRMNQFPIQYTAASPGDYYDWRAQTHGFEDMAAWEGWSQIWSRSLDPREASPSRRQAVHGSWRAAQVVYVSRREGTALGSLSVDHATSIPSSSRLSPDACDCPHEAGGEPD